MSKEQELKEILKLYSKQDLWNRIQEKQAMIYDLEAKLAEKEKENLTLFSILYETLEKQGYENITSAIEQMTNLTLEKQSNWLKENCVKNQDKISFAVDILEELADCSNYINSKLGFESGSYVSEKSIRDKIKYLKGNKYE